MSTIGLDYTSAVRQSAGIGRYTRELVKALAQVDAVSSYRLFVAGAGKGIDQPPPGPNFTWCPTRFSERWLARFWYRLRLPLPVQTWTGPLHLFHQPDFFLPPVKRATPTILTVHDLSFECQPSASIMPGMEAHLKKWVPRSVQRARHIIAVSEATRQDLIKHYHTPPQKITTLYHGVTAEFQPIANPVELARVRQKYGLAEHPFILSVSTIQPRKNYRRLIRAFAQIDPAYSLVIAGGKGWGYEDVLAEVSHQGLENRVHFPGFIADADLPALYTAAAAFVYPSLYEGFGLPLLEAMACGTPVLASNQSSLPEVVGQAGLLVDPYDVDALAAALAQLLAEPDLRQHLCRAGYRQVKKFTWQGMARELVKLYRQLLSPLEEKKG